MSNSISGKIYHRSPARTTCRDCEISDEPRYLELLGFDQMEEY